jgi:16S rRNA (guanine1516-N2)-methyltransferase
MAGLLFFTAAVTMVRGHPAIAVHCAKAARRTDAKSLAAMLSLPLIDTVDHRFDFLLTYTGRRLELRKTSHGAPGPIYVDFVSGSLGYRRIRGGGRRQLLAKAVGIRASSKASVIDVTAGLGSDAFVLAILGCRVLMLERSAIVHALLADGLDRARPHPVLGAALSERLALRHLDAISHLDHLPGHDRPDVIYLDPMYPRRDQSALNKKEMRILRELVGDDEDAPALLIAGLTCARQRVVVKRPRLALPLQGPPPTIQLRGETTRYDIYNVGVRG